MDDLLIFLANDDYLKKIENYVPSAWIGHAPFMKYLFREAQPKNFVELGTHNGFSYFVANQAIRELGLTCKTWAVDHWLGDEQAGFFEETVFESVKLLNLPYESFSTLLRMSFDEALDLFEDQSIDLLHIDGHHSYESVTKDFETWLPKMRKSGIILLHDIHVRRNGYGVHKLWQSLKPKYKNIEFVGSHGLGVIFLDQVPSGGLNEIYQASLEGSILNVQGTFGSIADDVIQVYRQLENQRMKEQLTMTQIELSRITTKLQSIEDSTIWVSTKPFRSIINYFKKQK